MHDVGLRYALSGSTHVRWPHVHSHRLDRCALRRRERLQQAHCRVQLSLRNQVQHPRPVDVGQDAGVSVALSELSSSMPRYAISSSVRRSMPRSTALTMMALTVLQDSRVSVRTA